MSISSRTGLQKGHKGKIGPISAPQDGRPLNADTFRVGGPISLSAIGRQDVNVDTAPEAAKRRELRRHDVEDERTEVQSEEGGDEETAEEKINVGEQAWREGDEIIVENEEGEVIRTVSSPRSSKSIPKGEEGEGITGRLRRIWSGQSWEKHPRRANIDLEKGVPESEEENENAPSPGRMESSPRMPSAGAPLIVVDEDNRVTGHVSDRMERLARQEREQETEVERRRREAVLGLTQDSDDEDEGRPHPARPRHKSKAVESPSEDEEDRDVEGRSEGPSSRSHSSAGGAESSYSGTQLLSAPAPPRTRGIRFGDISVGQESFSLEEGPPSTGTGARHHKTGSGDWRARRRSDVK